MECQLRYEELYLKSQKTIGKQASLMRGKIEGRHYVDLFIIQPAKRPRRVDFNYHPTNQLD